MLSKKLITALLSMIYTFCLSQNFYNPSSIKDIKLTFPRADYDVFLDSVKSKGSDARLKGSMTIDGQKFEEVGVRYKGNSSYFGTRKKGLNKFPFNVKLKKKDKIEGKYNTLKLSNVNRDASFIREALSYEIVRTYMPAPQCNYARVYVNEKMMGFYNNVEAIDDHFIKNHYDFPKNLPNGRQDTEGWLVKCDPEWTAEESKTCPKGDKASLMYLGEDSTCYKSLYDIDKDGSWREFIQFVKTLNQEPEKIERILNVDQTLWMLALNNVLVNLDSYNGLFCHNYYLMRGADGRFTPLMWDLNMSLGGFVFDGVQQTPLSIEQLQTMQPLQHIDNPKRPLIAQVLKIPMYQKIYLAHMKTILSDWFTNEKYLQKAKELTQLIDNQVNADKNKHYSYEEFKQNLTKSVGNPKESVIGIEELMKARTSFLNNHPLIKKTSPKIETKPTPLLMGQAGSVSDDKMTIKVKVTGATRVWFVNRTDKNGVFRYAPMLDDGKHNDDAAGDGIYGVVVDKKAYLQYFINAEGEEAVSLLPERAAYEFFEWKL
jgi:CotH kinase protein